MADIEGEQGQVLKKVTWGGGTPWAEQGRWHLASCVQREGKKEATSNINF